MPHKAGFVNIIGSPNVGKSTLMNALVGEKLSIVSSKVQTTRHRIMAFLNAEDFQIVFSDTPGILKPAYALQKVMMDFVDLAFQDADLFLFVTEAGGDSIDGQIIQNLAESEVPVLVVVNKIDTVTQEQVEARVNFWHEQLPKAEIIPVSALHKFSTDLVLRKIISLLPESPAYYPKDELTDRTMRFFVSEIIREKILLLYDREIPYSVEVHVESYKEKEDLVHIQATIFTVAESKKMILIGKGGSAIKRMGIEARKDIEEFVGQKVYLDLSVKVKKDWRDDPNALRSFGYSIS
jgi:GTPase